MSDTLTFLAVHAHPDDETLGTGGTLARYADEGIRTALVCCTHGEEGEIHDPDLDPAEAQPRLGAIREGELRAAATILGIAELRFLPYRDSGMDGTPANRNPDNFMNADPHEATRRLAAIIRELRPQVVVTYDEKGGYGHPDHKMAHRITHLAIAEAEREGPGGEGWWVQKLYYTAFPLSTLRRINAEMQARGMEPWINEDNPDFDVKQFAAPDDVITTRVLVREYRDRVRAAIRAHRTQIPEGDPLFALPDDLTADAFAHEAYIRAFTRVPAPEQEDDLFAGLR